MEELRSTEVLDKEIQADARKKAEKILSKADIDSQLLLEEVPELVKKAKKEIEDKNNSKIAAYEKDQNATLPLEKERFRVSFIQSQLNKAFDSYFSSMSDEKKIDILIAYSKRFDDVLSSKKLNAQFYGFSQKLIKDSLSKSFDVVSYTQTEFNKVVIENDYKLSEYKGIILESEDKSVRVRLTISELIYELQDKYRQELFDALFGGRLEQ